MSIVNLSQNLSLKLSLQIVTHAVYFQGRREVLRESVSGKRCSDRLHRLRQNARVFYLAGYPADTALFKQLATAKVNIQQIIVTIITINCFNYSH